MPASVFGHFATPASVQGSLIKTPLVVTRFLSARRLLSGVRLHPGTVGDAILGRQVLREVLCCLRDW